MSSENRVSAEHREEMMDENEQAEIVRFAAYALFDGFLKGSAAHVVIAGFMGALTQHLWEMKPAHLSSSDTVQSIATSAAGYFAAYERADAEYGRKQKGAKLDG